MLQEVSARSRFCAPQSSRRAEATWGVGAMDRIGEKPPRVVEAISRYGDKTSDRCGLEIGPRRRGETPRTTMLRYHMLCLGDARRDRVVDPEIGRYIDGDFSFRLRWRQLAGRVLQSIDGLAV